MCAAINNIISNLEEMEQFATFLRAKYWNSDYTIFFLYGGMGVGKTQLIKYILSPLLAPKYQVTSPTFSLLNIYKGLNGADYLHFDFYRKNAIQMEDLEVLGLHNLYENKSNKCFIEWPERIINVHTMCGVHITLSLGALGPLEALDNLRYIHMMEVK